MFFRVLARTSILLKNTFRKKSEKFTNFRREAFVPFGLENDMINDDFDNDAFSK